MQRQGLCTELAIIQPLGLLLDTFSSRQASPAGCDSFLALALVGSLRMRSVSGKGTPTQA